MTQLMEASKSRFVELTEAMRTRQEEIAELGSQRRGLWYRAWAEQGVTQKEIAEASGVTRQVVYLEIKRYLKAHPELVSNDG